MKDWWAVCVILLEINTIKKDINQNIVLIFYFIDQVSRQTRPQVITPGFKMAKRTSTLTLILPAWHNDLLINIMEIILGNVAQGEIWRIMLFEDTWN